MSIWTLPIPARFARLFATEERRITRRHDCLLEMYCQPNDGTGRDTWWLGEVHDLSVHGIGLLSSRRFEPGTRIDIELQESARTPKRLLSAWVVHAKPHPEGGWTLGCAFERKMSERELRSWLSIRA